MELGELLCMVAGALVCTAVFLMLARRASWRERIAELGYLPEQLSGIEVRSQGALERAAFAEFKRAGTRAFWLYRRKAGVGVLRANRYKHARGEQWLANENEVRCLH